MSPTASFVIVSPGSSRTSAGPPTDTFPVYPLIPTPVLKLSPAIATVLGMVDAMDASGALPTSGGAVGLPATEIAARVRAGELTSVEVVRAHLAHIDAVDPRIGAFRVVRHEAALAEAAAVDARPDRASLPLAGVPV